MRYNVHLDNPKLVSDWMNTLTDHEREILHQGQIHAYTQVIDQLRQSKIKLLNKRMELEEQDETKKLAFIDSRIELLDIYERYYLRRIEHMTARFDAPALLTSIDPEYA